jgi:hypothetical protein
MVGELTIAICRNQGRPLSREAAQHVLSGARESFRDEQTALRDEVVKKVRRRRS